MQVEAPLTKTEASLTMAGTPLTKAEVPPTKTEASTMKFEEQPSAKKARKDDDERVHHAVRLLLKSPILTVPQVRSSSSRWAGPLRASFVSSLAKLFPIRHNYLHRPSPYARLYQAMLCNDFT